MSSPNHNMQKHVEQLRQEASIQRINVSQAVNELVEYMYQHAEKDGLLVGMPPSGNPYRDQKNCIIL